MLFWAEIMLDHPAAKRTEVGNGFATTFGIIGDNSDGSIMGSRRAWN